jgi:hypothetical protein
LIAKLWETFGARKVNDPRPKGGALDCGL